MSGNNMFDEVPCPEVRTLVVGTVVDFFRSSANLFGTDVVSLFIAMTVSYVNTSGEGASVSKLSDLTGISRRTVKRNLEALMEQGVVIKKEDGMYPLYYRYTSPEDLKAHTQSMCDMAHRFAAAGMRVNELLEENKQKEDCL